MRQRELGRSGIRVPVLGQGTWKVRDTKAAKVAIEEGLRLGMTHIDTAELYEWRGGSETMLGELLSRPGRSGGTLRDNVILASKVWPDNASKAGVRRSLGESLARLKTDRLDLYYHHWPGTIPMEETMRALAAAQDDGLVRSIGVSNYGVDDLEAAEAILGKRRIVANQVEYHLLDRSVEREGLPWCKAHGVTIVGYSPYGQATGFPKGKQLAELEAAGKEVGLTPHQAALAFLSRDEGVVLIPKAESIPHVRENAGGDAVLPRDVTARIDELFS